MSDLKIRDVRTIITHPPGARTLTVVKVETDGGTTYWECLCLILWADELTDLARPFLWRPHGAKLF